MSKRRSDARAHEFGGDWTELKLELVARYLKSYTTALSRTSFLKAYIDAFAGTGYRQPRRPKTDESEQKLPFVTSGAQEPRAQLDGSARIALKTAPRFDRYVFIERNAARCAQLEDLKSEFPDLASDIHIYRGDANQEIQDMCAKDWRDVRAVLFLDPYGLQVKWATIEAIARTKAIDTWILFPLSGVNRMLTQTGDIDESWRRCLDDLLGTTAWFEEFYRKLRTPTLFGLDERTVKRASTETIARYFVERLKTRFSGVSENPRVLSNSTSPLYLLCFATGANPAGAKIALRIANHLLKAK